MMLENNNTAQNQPCLQKQKLKAINPFIFSNYIFRFV